VSSPANAHLLINLLTPAGANAGKALRLGRKFVGLGWRVTVLIQADGVGLLDPEADLAPCPVTGRSPAAGSWARTVSRRTAWRTWRCPTAWTMPRRRIAEILASPDVRTLSF